MARVIGVFFSPHPTFADIARRPSWIVPVVMLSIISTGICLMLAQKVNWENVAAKRIDQGPQAEQLKPEERQQRIALGVKISRIALYVAGPAGNLIAVAFFAAIFLGAFNLFAGAGVRYGTAMGIVSHAFVPTFISGILGIVVLAVKTPDTLDPEHLLATNLGEFLSGDAPKWLVKAAASVDIFVIWILALIAIGFAAAAPKKVSTAKAMSIVFGIYVAYRLIVVGWAAI
jgi:hypothetical protein